MKKYSNISGFSIIEVMIAIFIFSMWMASIFMVINSSINVDILNKDYIIASNLAREQVEVIRSIRDDNYANHRKWNYIPNSLRNFSKVFEIWKYYKIENDYSSSEFPFIIKTDWNQIFTTDNKQDFLNWKFDDYQLCVKKDINTYSYICDSNDINIKFYKYIQIEELKDSWGIVISDTMKVKSKVIWYSKWYHEFEINTILSNFNRY